MKLKTENPNNAKKALKAFCALHHESRYRFNCIFEHGQLWIVGRDGSQYSVCDASGPGSIAGFDFEMVTEPQE